jgi:serine/threonine protein kinase
MSLEAVQAIGPYDVLEIIARGGVATIFRARHRETEQVVALKAVFPPHNQDEVLLKRFKQEFRASSELSHPNIVRAVDFGSHETVTYLALEFVNGPNLAERVARDGPLPEAEAIRIIVQAAQGLHHAHKHGIVHRDVKPENILLAAKGQAKLADLGLMKDLETDLGLTRNNQGLGTPCFMAPEQFHDAKRANLRCDIYSLGATLFYAVTGQVPFKARSIPAIWKKKQANDLTPPRALAPALSERVERAILRAVRADPGVRPRSCLEFIAALTTDTPDSVRSRSAGPASRRDGRAKSGQTPSAERRVSVRYPCSVDSACRRNTSIHADDEHVDEWEATIQDLSVKGAGLIVNRRFEIGTMVTLEFPTSGSASRRSVDMRVNRVHRAGRGLWFIGGSFTRPLDKKEVQSLL